MSALAPGRTAERELGDLYGRYKTLVLAAAAALMLDRPLGDVAEECSALVDDCVRAAVAATGFQTQLAACRAAAEELAQLVDLGGDERLEAVRASHRRLRREVWTVLPCEYVPCCAPAHAHAHR